MKFSKLKTFSVAVKQKIQESSYSLDFPMFFHIYYIFNQIECT